ncbi:MAG: 16S rRNA (guanine(966)-N(2))-methyltransferase RsmD [Eubacterium sp.]|nr:16S rRNA (guanine(966)-N(2))-methyltransferase RsmD [Eubacterium sp.]
MRVIAGSARHISLVAPTGEGTRPTSDRIKETLFNILQQDIPGCRFLDLFAGSGGIGIEALSRGASEASFIERDKKALLCIRENLTKTKLKQLATVYPSDYTVALRQLNKIGEPFDIIFADPPYQSGYEAEMMRLLTEKGAADTRTQIIIECSLTRKLDFADSRLFEIERIKNYKSNRHVFLRRKPM